MFLVACGQTDQSRINAAAATLADVRATRLLPDLPEDCRRLARSGVVDGTRLDVALLRTDAALVRQHQRTDRCADWYDQLQTGFAGSGAPQ